MNLLPNNRNRLAGNAGALSLVAVVAVASLVFAPAASAHDGRAIVTLENASPVAETSVQYTVRAVWDNDGHPAADATVTVVAEGPDGARVGPVPMVALDTDGRYQATVEFPGTGEWSVRFTIVTPPGSLERTETLPVAATDATVPVTSAAPPTTSVPSTTAAPTTSEPATDVAARSSEEEGSSSGGAAVFFFVTAAIILGACLLAYRSRSKRSGGEP